MTRVRAIRQVLGLLERDERGQSVLEYVLVLSAFVTLFALIQRWALVFLREWFDAMIAVIAGPGV